LENIIKKYPFIRGDKKKRILVAAVLLTVVVFVFCGLYLNFAWNRYNDIAASEAIHLAISLESMLHPEEIEKLSGNTDDLDKPEYRAVKTNLENLIQNTEKIRFAYIMAQQDGKVVFLVDSEPPESPDYSPPGQVYFEVNEELKSVFLGDTVLSHPAEDRWGYWISALVPIRDNETGEVIALFGIDYSAKEWQRGICKSMIPDIVIVISVLILYVLMLYGWTVRSRNTYLNKQILYDETLFDGAFTKAPIGVAIVNGKNFIYESHYGHLSMNPMFEKILGRTSKELEHVKWTEITHPDDLSRDLALFDKFTKGEIDGYTLEKRFRRPDGSYVWTNMIISRLFASSDNHLCLLEDISERKKAVEELKENMRRETVLFSHLPGLAYRRSYDSKGTMQIVSEGCYHLTGYTPENLIGNNKIAFCDLIAPEDREILQDEWARTIPNKLPYQCEYRITTASGEQKWVLEMGQGFYNEAGEAEALEGIILDITDRKRTENNLRYINEHDALTGLLNRKSLEKDFLSDDMTLLNAKRALIGLDLSTVELLTTNYGFQYTQNLIKKAADTLKTFCTGNYVLYRTYENRFLFYAKNYQDKKELMDFCETVASALETLLVTDRIGGGIGVVEIPPQNDAPLEDYLKKSLFASEKSIGHADKDFVVKFYDHELEEYHNRESEILQELSRIAADQDDEALFLLYQPILDLKTNTVSGFEALARLKTDKLGLVSPIQFIPIAEKTKLIVPIGEKIFYKAFRFLNRLAEKGYPGIGVSVNVSAVQLLRPDFADRLFEIINETQTNPYNITLEITESVFSSDYEKINGILTKLKEKGLQIAIDDFGTGYSSLARERELNVDCLKIDKFFIDSLLIINKDKAITADIISMAHKLGHSTVAEGVEFEQQKQYLRENGCDKIQGYLLSKPIDEEKALRFLNQGQES
jgi:PAS domain S-box-containing protein